MKIGEKIRMIREMKGISQEAIATHLDISPQAYGKIEREETKLDTNRIRKIADYLGVKFEDIITFDGENIFNNTFNQSSTGNFNVNDSKEGFKIIERLLTTIEGRFEKYDVLLDKNLNIIERFGELIKK
jgi:transcriptional regulator with XRE-family HTH domain